MPELAISTEKIEFIIDKARAFDAKDSVVDSDPASNSPDDRMIDVLEDRRDDPVAREIAGFINALTLDEQIDLVTLVRIGRGDGAAGDWNEIRAEAARNHNAHTARYLLGEPLLGDFLAEGLDEIGRTLDNRVTMAS